ncbi:sigma-70 family RNA polymerase sigma factor [Brevibacillus composti]|uniref:Sigma-70 family RNA polymerase sigma factor n=1 Tax=Brevibacillus composti TaxID=2796470 RepID=A0A7T5JMG1_9BACL|nr:sigma-70 family RNA polymerase sigma factor [Brevibacillus composti]QQE73082.1 sigma-70 family RNA polymerase sigma factor [Brevibacillus composti]QUO40160.1 sigma-70 family RNA polymerase sigma factor [Brevibacillus composti]
MNPQAFEKMSRFRQKVIRLVIIEKKSIYETAIACGCTAEKVRRVLKKWRYASRAESSRIT